jgi:hypothetical protein
VNDGGGGGCGGAEEEDGEEEEEEDGADGSHGLDLAEGWEGIKVDGEARRRNRVVLPMIIPDQPKKQEPEGISS